MTKHILIINNGLAGGGIERSSVSLANYFYSKGHHVSVLALYLTVPFYKLSDGIVFYEPTFSRTHLNKFVYLVKMIKYIKDSVKRINPDTILAFGEWTNPFVLLALKGTNCPIFVSDRMNPLAKLPYFTDLFRMLFYKNVAGIIAQSNFAKTVLFKKTKSNKIHVIYNPVNIIDKIDCERKNRIVTVGRLEGVKGHKYLIEAFAKVPYENWELSIVGEGSLRESLENLSKYLGVYERVIFHGHLEDFRLQLSESQIFVLPSLKEGFPNALIEAMSLPMACIATDTFYGHNEIIEHGCNGLLVKPGSSDELANAISLLISDKNLRDSLKVNAIKVRRDLRFELIAQKYLDLIIA